MTSNADCLKLAITCSKLERLCSLTMNSVLSSFTDSGDCKSALRSDINTNVRYFCRESCGECGKLCRKCVHLFDDS